MQESWVSPHKDLVILGPRASPLSMLFRTPFVSRAIYDTNLKLSQSLLTYIQLQPSVEVKISVLYIARWAEWSGKQVFAIGSLSNIEFYQLQPGHNWHQGTRICIRSSPCENEPVCVY